MINQEYKEKIINVNNYVKNGDVLIDKSHIDDLISILSLDNPDPRDIIIGCALSNSDKFSTLLNEVPSHNRSDLNVLNIKIILSLYQDREYSHLLQEAETLLDKGIPGTTLFGLLKNEIEQEYDYEDSNKSMIYGFILNSEELSKENDLFIF